MLVFNAHLGTALWCTPAQAQRMMSVVPTLELIEENNRFYGEYAKLAGPKPEFYPRRDSHGQAEAGE